MDRTFKAIGEGSCELEQDLIFIVSRLITSSSNGVATTDALSRALTEAGVPRAFIVIEPEHAETTELRITLTMPSTARAVAEGGLRILRSLRAPSKVAYGNSDAALKKARDVASERATADALQRARACVGCVADTITVLRSNVELDEPPRTQNYFDTLRELDEAEHHRLVRCQAELICRTTTSGIPSGNGSLGHS